MNEEFEKEGKFTPAPSQSQQVWFPTVSLQDSHGGANKVAISSMFED